MNADQIGGIIRALMAGLSGYAIAFGFTDSQWITITAAIVSVITVLWSIYSNSTHQQIVSVAESPEVKQVVVKDPGLAMSIPSNKVVAPGGSAP